MKIRLFAPDPCLNIIVIGLGGTLIEGIPGGAPVRPLYSLFWHLDASHTLTCSTTVVWWKAIGREILRMRDPGWKM